MNWPLPQDFNEAIQNPATAFADADLKRGAADIGPVGVPLPRSGNFADVYRVRAADGRSWAVKCFTRPVEGLAPRYAAIDAHLAKANLPFTIGFSYLPEGIRVRGAWYPVVKMPWVEGQPVNTLVRENLGRASVLESLLGLWVRLCRRLRETGMAHCDLQHGNVILVPGASRSSLGLKLVDYDGMFVPELAGRPTGEAGHSAYQHPERVARNVYSADLDRFPHLVVATAIRGLMVGGKGTWDRYDTGDNLLFTEKDFLAPARSALMRELWQSGDPFTAGLVAHLAIACTKPLAQTPWLDLLMPEGRPPVLTPSQERQAAEVLGFAAPVAVAAPAPAIAQPARFAFDEDDEEEEQPAIARRPAKAAARRSPLPFVLAGVGALVLLGGGVGAFLALGQKDKAQEVVAAPTEPVSTAEVPKPTPLVDTTPKPTPPQPVVPQVPVEAAAPKFSLRPVWSVRPDPKRAGRDARFNADGSLVVLALDDKPGIALTLDPATGQTVGQFTDHASACVAAPGPGDHVFSVGCGEPVIICWDGRQSRKISRVPLPGGGGTDYTRISVGAAGKHALLETAADCTVLDLETGRVHAGLGTLKSGLVCLNRAGDQLLAADPASGQLTVWQLDATPRALARVAAPAVRLLAWSPDGKHAAIHDADRNVLVVELATGKTFRLFGATGAGTAAFTADGNSVVVAGTDARTHAARMIAYRAPAWKRSASGGTPAGVTALDFAPTGSRVVATGRDGTVTLLELSEGGAPVAQAAPPVVTPTPMPKPVPPVVGVGVNGMTDGPPAFVWRKWPGEIFKGGKALQSPRFSKDGKTVYVALLGAKQGDKQIFPTTLHVLDAATGEVRASSELGPAWRVGLIPTPNGQVVAVLQQGPRDAPSEIQVRDGRTGALVGASFTIDKGFNAGSGRCAVSPDGRYLVGVGGEATGQPVGHVADLTQRKLVTDIAGWNPGALVLFTNLGGELVLSAISANKVDQYRGPDFGDHRTNPVPNADASDTRYVTSLSADGRSLLLGRFDPAARCYVFWTRRKREQQLDVRARLPRYSTLRGDRAIVVEGQGNITVADTGTGRKIATIHYGEPLLRGAVSPDGETVLVGSFNNRLSLIRLPAATPGSVAVRPVPVPPTPAPTPVTSNRRKPIPSGAAVEAALKLIRETFKTEYADKTAGGKHALAELLLKKAEKTTDDPAAQYTLFRQVLDLGVETKDTALLTHAAEGIGERFDADPFAVMADGLERLATAGAIATRSRAIAAVCQEQAEAAIEAEHYDAATKLLTVGGTILRRAGYTAATSDLNARLAQVKKLKQRYAPVEAALAKLKANAADPDANLTVGRFRCFAQGRWDDGLKLLAKSGDAALKALAERDLQAGRQSPPDAALGDAWAEALPKAADEDRHAYEARARYWYARAALAQTGLTRSRVEAKLTYTSGATKYRPGLVGEWFLTRNNRPVKVFARTDSTLDFSGGDFITERITTKERGAAIAMHWAGVLVPPVPGRYKLSIETQEPVLVKLDGKVVLSVVRERGRVNEARTQREATVLLGDRPVPLDVNWTARSFDTYHIKLNWTPPGSSEEVVPPDCLFHDKKAEALLKVR